MRAYGCLLPDLAGRRAQASDRLLRRGRATSGLPHPVGPVAGVPGSAGLSLRHVPCGTTIGLDPSYPYPDGSCGTRRSRPRWPQTLPGGSLQVLRCCSAAGFRGLRPGGVDALRLERASLDTGSRVCPGRPGDRGAGGLIFVRHFGPVLADKSVPGELALLRGRLRYLDRGRASRQRQGSIRRHGSVVLHHASGLKMGPGVLPYPTGTRIRALSSVGPERLPYKQEVAGSNPAAPIEAPNGLPSKGHERYPLQPLHPCEDPCAARPARSAPAMVEQTPPARAWAG